MAKKKAAASAKKAPAKKKSAKKAPAAKKPAAAPAQTVMESAAATMGDNATGPYANLTRALSLFAQEIGRDPKEAYKEVKLIWTKITGAAKKKPTAKKKKS